MSQNRPGRTMLLSTACIFIAMAFCAGIFAGSLINMRQPQNSPNTAAAGESGHPPGYEEKLQAIQAEIDRQPEEPLNWISLGNLHYDANHLTEAIKAYEKALDLKPGNADVMVDLGTMYQRLGDNSTAINLFDQVIAQEPEHETAYFNKGVALMLDGDPAIAVQTWKRLLAAIPDVTSRNPSLLAENLPLLILDGGVELERLGKNDSALQAYDQVLLENAFFEPALSHKAFLLENLGRKSEAVECWQRLIELNPSAVAPDGRPADSFLP